jgi:transposase-like protein
LIALHKQASTTPKIRAAIQANTEPAWMVAERYGISEQTVWKWRNRDDVHDRSHTPHKLQTTLTPPQEAVAVALRKTLLLPLDDLLAVVREFLNPHVSRSGLNIPLLPAPDRRLRHARPPHDLDSPHALRRRQHDARSPRKLARRVAVGQQSLKFSAIGGAKVKADIRASHAPIMPRKSSVGNPTSGVEH